MYIPGLPNLLNLHHIHCELVYRSFLLLMCMGAGKVVVVILAAISRVPAC